MLSEYRFGTVEGIDSFEDETSNFIYFPITDSVDFPCDIRAKAEEMLEEIIANYEVKGYKLSISDSCLNARMISFVDNNKEWKNEISVLVAGGDLDMWMEKTYTISPNDALYKSFKAYFMEHIERKLFQI